MASERPFLFALNGGMVSPKALGRVDLTRMRITGERYENCFPTIIGPMQFRGGLGYEGATDGIARNIPFIFSVDDTALIEVSNLSSRFIVDGSPVTRANVASTITNGDFGSSTGWTLTTTGGGVANINSTTAGALTLQTPVRGGTALAKRSFTVAGGDLNVEHAIKVVVTRGSVRFRLGSTDGGNEYLGEFDLPMGTHSLAFTPTSSPVYVQYSAKSETYVIVDSGQIEAAGVLELVTEWPTADLFDLRFDQSGDVIFVTHDEHHPAKFIRFGTRSWSIVEYQFKDGPWKGKTANISMTPSVRLGMGTLTASAAFFQSEHVGALFEITHTKTTVDVSLAGSDVFTDTVRISGSDGNTRRIARSSSGTWSGTLTIQVAPEEDGPWSNWDDTTGNYVLVNITPGVANEILYSRIGFQSGEYTSGTANIVMSTGAGGGSGVVRVVSYVSPTVVNIEVVKRLHSSTITENWQEGKYSDEQGWPASVVLFEGRLWFGGRDQLAGSFSDDFSNFNVDEEGDSAPIIRSIATGPVNKVQWMLGLARLIIGTSGAESVPRSSSFDEPMTVTNFSIKDASTIGSANVAAVKIDRSGFFIGRSGKRAFDISYNVEANDYTTNEITRYNPTILRGVVKIAAVQRNPDTRIWFVLNDGTAACFTLDKSEDVLAWSTFITDGLIQDVCVLPNTDADDVFMIVKRTIQGVDQYYRERLAYDINAEGGDDNFMADSYVTATLAASVTMTGLTHLIAESVVVWADGSPLMTPSPDGIVLPAPTLFVVDGSGHITLPAAVTGDVTAGLPYEGFWKSTKLAYAAQTGTAVSQKKQVKRVAPLLYKTHIQSTLYGQDFTKMTPLPRVVRGADVGADGFLDDYDFDGFALPGKWDNDSRLCLKFRAPLPATVLGLGLEVESHA